MTPQISVMGGKLGDIFWDLSPWIVYAAGFDLGCNVYVANPTDTEKEYALMARLTQDTTVISEEALPVFGYTWFKVDPGDFVRLHGALRFSESDVDLAVLLIERETEEITDSVSTRLVAPTATTTPSLPPTWPGATGATGYDWSSLMGTMLPVMMLAVMGMVMVSSVKPQAEKERVIPPAKERKLLTAGRQE